MIQPYLYLPYVGQSTWILSSSSDPWALAIVDGNGMHHAEGPHYSRRKPGSKTFTGIGQEIVLVTDCGRAVWSCVRQLMPRRPDRWVFRNNVFRNLGAGLSSDLIRAATIMTYEQWILRYGSLPPERLRTEIDVDKVRSTNPGYCYWMAGWERGELRKGKRFAFAPIHAVQTKTPE
jgi:hypothetical protein